MKLQFYGRRRSLLIPKLDRRFLSDSGKPPSNFFLVTANSSKGFSGAREMN